ncbi:MAG: trigger factor [Eubacterium sp.]|nr:trigger factor [Eubacterium sp.]
MKKKILMVLLAAVMAVSASACGNEKQNGGSADTQEGGSGAGSEKGGKESTAQADKVSYQADECVKLGEYFGMEVSLPNDYKVTKAQIEDYANSMAQYSAQPSYRDTNKKKVEEGDIVNIDYEGKKDGVAFDGGTDTGYHLEIGSGTFIDGFEEGLIGKKVGQTVDLDLTFPENYQSTELAGQAVVFTVKINKIVEVDPDAEFELNDEYVQKNFNMDTVADFKKQVKEYLEESNKNSKQTDTRQAVINKLHEVCEVNLPDELLEARTADYVVQFTNRNCTDGTSLADYLSQNYNGMTEDDFKSDLKSEMQTNLTTELILEAIAKKEGIELDEEGFADYVKQQMEVYAYETEEDFYKANGVDAVSGEAYERKVYVCNQALDQVVENAKITYGVTPEDSEK